MAFNALKKWIGTQLWSTFMQEYNSNVDELNRVIPEIETNISLLQQYQLIPDASGQGWTSCDNFATGSVVRVRTEAVANKPFDYCYIVTHRYFSFGVQIAYGFAVNSIMYRRLNTTWTAWITIK